MRTFVNILSVVAITFQRAVAEDTFQQKCLSFAPQKGIFNSTLAILNYVPAGTNLSLADQDKSCSPRSQIVPVNVCRTALHVPTSNRSSITMELWLPETWQGRVLAVGNGGVDGCISYPNIAYGVQNGFATVGANGGHNGSGGHDFLNNPDVIVDFVYRSLHTSIAQAKNLSSSFYGSPYHKSYYLGCSQGGRQGLGAAERYPRDFDGIVAGSPASDWNHLYAWRGSFYHITGRNTSVNFINADKWAVIHGEVLAQCDTLDGVKDGIIEDPSLCVFRPEQLLCADARNTSQCLTAPQVEIVNKIYRPFYGTEGDLLYPAMQPGNELLASAGLYSGTPWPLSQDWYRYVVLNDSTWDSYNLNLSLAEFADQQNPSGIRTYPTTLAPFASTGGKLITYHGQQDQQITSFQSPRLYNHLARGMNASSSDLDSFYRFFRISGMGHCSNGPGAWAFGQSGGSPNTKLPFQPEGNILSAIVEWVENDRAPETMLGTKFVNDDVTKGVAFSRRHCRYPRRNTYIGGNASSADSWACEYV